MAYLLNFRTRQATLSVVGEHIFIINENCKSKTSHKCYQTIYWCIWRNHWKREINKKYETYQTHKNIQCLCRSSIVPIYFFKINLFKKLLLSDKCLKFDNQNNMHVYIYIYLSFCLIKPSAAEKLWEQQIYMFNPSF